VVHHPKIPPWDVGLTETARFPRLGGDPFAEKGSPAGTFSAPAPLLPGEALGRHTFLVKQHDCGDARTPRKPQHIPEFLVSQPRATAGLAPR